MLINGRRQTISGALANDGSVFVDTSSIPINALERVEVLSGPQSTLFGKNASAGVVSVVTPVPTGESGGFISGSFGDLGAVVVKALVEGSLSDNVAFDFAGSYNSRDGYFKNLQTGAELNERNRFAVRGQLNWTPSDTTAIRVIADYDQLEESCCGVINLFSGPATLAINALGGQIVPNDPDALEGFYDDPAVNEISNFGLSVQGDFEYEKFSITSITSFRNNDVLDNQDIDFSSADLTNSNKNDINIDTFTQEIRFASNGDGAVDWLVGGFYFDESVEQDTDVLFGPKFSNFIDILLAQAGVPFGLSTVEALSGIPQGSFYQNNSGISSVATLDNKAFSVFGQFDWHATDSLTATLGFNYTDDEKDYSLDSTRTEVRGMFNLGPLNFVPIFPPVTTDTQNPVEDSRTSDDKVTYTARLAWDINGTYNSYISYSTGFKASSINLSRDSAPSPADFATLGSLGLLAANTRAGSRFAQPEEAKVIELGVKARFDRGSLNIAVFDQVLDNFQSNAFVGDAFVLANAERQSVKGAEINFSYSPTDSFSYGVNMTILDPLYDSFTGSAGGDISGEVPSGISELSASFSAQYEFQLGGNEAYVRGDYQYEDKVQVVDGISPDIASREVKLLNVSAGMTTDSGMSYTLWARNLADESFLISAFPSVAQEGSFSGYRNEPRTFGLTVRKDF